MTVWKAVLLLAFLQSAFLNASGEYHIPAFRTNWFKANEFCNSIGMRLATVKSQAENDAIGNFIRKSDKFNPAGCWFWIGASDLAENGSWTWSSTGALVTYFNWGKGEPNNVDNSEHCLHLSYTPQYTGTWTWNDIKCEFKTLYFVCENTVKDCVQQF